MSIRSWYYEDMGQTIQQADADFETSLIDSFATAHEKNAYNNDAKSEHLHNANQTLVLKGWLKQRNNRRYSHSGAAARLFPCKPCRLVRVRDVVNLNLNLNPTGLCGTVRESKAPKMSVTLVSPFVPETCSGFMLIFTTLRTPACRLALSLFAAH